MIYFTSDFLNFFKELAANNHKDWFDENRKRYEKNVKQPFEGFVSDLIAAVGGYDKSVDITYKEAIFRINRDIRFSKDKTPYKLNRSAIISSKGRKDKSYPGLYVEMGPEHYRVYGGVYQPDKEQLYNIREAIIKQPQKFRELIEAPAFKKQFGEVRGDRNKVLPKEFKAAAEKEPYLYHKQFYWFTEFSPEIITQKDLLAVTMQAYLANQDLMKFFEKAMA